MDNKQATEAQKGWLGGLIDGEGTISMRVYKRKNGYWRSSVYMKIFNTNKLIINEAINILSLMNIPHYVSSSNRLKSQKICYEIIISGLMRCNNALSKIHPYLVGKSKQSELLQKFINRRINHNKLYSIGKTYYTEDDLIDIQEIRKLNQRGFGVLNDYTLPTKKEFCRKYSLNSVGNSEKQAEMSCSIA